MTPAEIFAAFPDVAPYPKDVTGCPPEIFDIDRDFRGKSWQDIDAKACIQHSDALLMLHPKPLKYFLPAFLVAGLEQPESVAAESLVYFVCSEAFDAITPDLDPRQRAAVIGAVETIMNADRGYFAEQTDTFLRKLGIYGAR